MAVEKLIVDHIDTWTTALQTRSTAGRGSSGKIDLYGIKKLRELILELAVRGKLVPQDPNDEPASELLKRIAAEKAELVKQGKIKKPKPLPEISEEEKPFELPEGWERVRFGSIYEMEYGNNLPQEKRSNSGEYNVYGSNGIVGTHNEACIKSPCIVIGRKGSAGALNLSDQAACWVTDVAYSTIPPSAMNLEFVFIQFHTLGLDTLGKGIKPGLNRNDAYNLTIAIPPQSEQKAIVSKVNELMSLCDQLEQHSLTGLDAHQQLVETLLTTLTDSQNADELAANWARLSEHFDTLFTTEASIDALKQTILQLAVMGKLVQSTDVVEYKKLKTFLSFGPRNGFSPVESKNKTRFKVLKLGATSYGELNIQESKFVDIDIDSNSHLYIKEGDILIQRGNSANFVGCNVLVKENHKNIIYPDLMMKIRTNEDLLPEYASIWLSSPLARGFMWDRMTGTSGTMPKISKKVVEDIPIIVPSIATQQKCIAFVNLAIKICSDLKIRLQTSQQTQLHLADALTNAAIN
ncbi:restriction endonuclease subunit S [Klebsiella aerogenes]